MLQKLLMLVILLGVPGVALAGRVRVEPQARVYAGLNVAGGPATGAPSLGFALGFDGRMTRILSLDVGGFASPGAAPTLDTPAEDAAGSFFLRHGIFMAPGLRIPHRASDNISWDIVFRGGFGGVWWADVASHPQVTATDVPLVGMSGAVLGGIDLVLRRNALGVRVSGKAFGFRPFSEAEKDLISLVRPTGAAELFYQW